MKIGLVVYQQHFGNSIFRHTFHFDIVILGVHVGRSGSGRGTLRDERFQKIIGLLRECHTVFINEEKCYNTKE